MGRKYALAISASSHWAAISKKLAGVGQKQSGGMPLPFRTLNQSLPPCRHYKGQFLADYVMARERLFPGPIVGSCGRSGPIQQIGSPVFTEALEDVCQLDATHYH